MSARHVRQSSVPSRSQERFPTSLMKLSPTLMKTVSLSSVPRSRTETSSSVRYHLSGAKITAFQSNSTVEGATPLATDITQAGEWLFDPARVQGDYVVILSQDKTRVLVYYFECNEPSWQYQVKNQLIVSAINDWATQLQANNPSYEVNKGWMEQFTY